MSRLTYKYNDCIFYHRISNVFGVKAQQALFVDTKGVKYPYASLTGGIEKGLDIGVKDGCVYAFCVLQNAGALLSFLNVTKHFYRLFTIHGEIEDITAFKKELENLSDGYFHTSCLQENDLLNIPVTIYFPFIKAVKAFPFFFVEHNENKKVTKISWDEPVGEYVISDNKKLKDYAV